MSNVERKESFNQVCVWPGVVVTSVDDDGDPGSTPEDFETYMQQEFDIRIQFLEEVVTLPREGEEGGRIDCFFAIHEDDISGSFCMKRLQYGMRWIEDVISNCEGEGTKGLFYPVRVIEYCGW